MVGLGLALAAEAAGPAGAPDVIPGIPNRLLREVTAGPFRLRVVQSGPERVLTVADATGPNGGRATWTTLDVGDRAIDGDPGDLGFSVTPLDRRVGDLFLVQVTSGREGSARIDTRYLVRRAPGHPRLVCHVPRAEGEVQVSIAAVTPALVIAMAAGAEQVRFTVGKDDVCRLTLPETGGAPSGDLAYRATLAQADMFRALERWEEAGDTFARALRLRPGAPGAEAIAISAMKARSNYLDLQCMPREGNLRRLPIDRLLKKQLDSYGDYLARFPTTDLATKVRFRRASQLELCGHLEEARDLYREILERAPGAELAPHARQHHEEVIRLIRERDGKPRR
jgi:hypothetical protein